MKTHSTKPTEITREWQLVDADGVVLGRLASEVAKLLRGKHKPYFAPHLDCGDHVVVINASKVAADRQQAAAKKHYRHSGYPGGLKEVSYAKLMSDRPELAIEKAVKGMLPSNKLGRAMLKKLKVYAGAGASARRAEPQGLGSEGGRRSAQPRAGAHHRGGCRWLTFSPGRRAAARRPCAAARFIPGAGQWSINGRPFEDYFPSPTHRMIITEPLRITKTEGRYDIIAKIEGGGTQGQAGALRHAISRALVDLDPELRGDPQEGRFPHPGRP